jgi:hypothetical protein
VIPLLLPAGCALNREARTLDLELQMRGYGAALRWAHYETAASYLRPRPGNAPWPGCVPREDLRVTAYQIREATIQDDDVKQARVRASIGYMEADSNAVKTAVDTQDWWFDPDSKRWYLDGGLPELVCRSDAAPQPPLPVGGPGP